MNDPKELVRGIEKALAAGDLVALEDSYAVDALDHSPFPDQSPGRAGIQEKAAALHAAIPDLATSVDLVLAEGDLVADRWTSRGTHQGELMGVPPTGRELVVTGISIFRVSEGVVVEEWTEFDGVGLLGQLGALTD